jgi:YD repeat-containing protein
VITGPPTVVVQDANGNTVTSAGTAITITHSGPVYSVLNGTKTRNASAGVANFSDLTIGQIASGYTLTASASGLTAATSSAFNVTAATGIIAGTVSRADNGAPIVGALVEAYTAGVLQGSTASGVTGSYSLSTLPPGIYEIRASGPGYISQPKGGIAVTVGGNYTVNFSLVQERIVYVYDSLSRLRGVIDAAGETATYSYDAVGNLLGISRYSSSQASVIEFLPNSGPPGTLVTIYGTGFSSTPAQTTVTFNGATAGVISSAPSQIITTVPPGATTGAIGVTSPAGSSASAAPFVVTSSDGMPTVTGFNPTIGAAGTSVTVTGTNFDTTPAKNDLRFNIARAAVGSSTSTSITTTVPTGTSSGRISVITTAGKGISSGDFFIPPSPLTSADIEFAARIQTNGTPLNVAINTPNKKGLLVFDGIAGQRINLRVRNSTFPFPCPTCFNVYLTFKRPDGQTWVNTGWSNTNYHYFEPGPLPMSGTYTVLWDPGSVTGQATVDFNIPTGEEQGTITPGIPKTLSVSIPGQNPQLTFAGTAGQLVSLNITNANFVLPCPWCQSAYVYIIKPDGQILSQCTWANAAGCFIDAVALPVSGTYRVLVNPTGDNIGRVTLTLYNLPPEEQGPINFGAPVTAITTLPGQNLAYSFSATVGQQISLAISNTTFPLACPWCSAASVQIYKPDGTLLIEKFWDIASFIFQDTTTLSDSGTYRLRLNPSGSGIGQATLALYNVPPEDQGSMTLGASPLNISFSVPGQNGKWTLAGDQNDRIMVNVANNTFSSLNLSLFRQDGSVLATRSSSASKLYLGPTFLPATESYTIKLDPAGASTGTASVNACSVPTVAPPSLPGTDTVWIDDAIPTGAGTVGTWTWDTTQKASGTQSHYDAAVSGGHQHYFYNASQGLTVNSGDKLFAYVLINPCSPPREIMLHWYGYGSWEHRAYWGENLISGGSDGTPSRFPMGQLPPAGQWVRLEVPAESVGLVGATVVGMSFSAYDGHAWFDRAGKSP